MSRSTELDPVAVVVSDDPSRVDVEVVWQFLSTAAYWGRWRAREDVEAQIRGAWRVVGAYASDDAMVGFARAFSDGVSGAYLADVFVLPAWRGRGSTAAAGVAPPVGPLGYPCIRANDVARETRANGR